MTGPADLSAEEFRLLVLGDITCQKPHSDGLRCRNAASRRITFVCPNHAKVSAALCHSHLMPYIDNGADCALCRSDLFLEVRPL